MSNNSWQPPPTKDALKKMAYAMKQSTGQKLGHCYEAIAQQYGYKTYAAMRSQMTKDPQ